MKVAVIAPIKHLDLSSLGDIFFSLAHLILESQRYAVAVRRASEQQYVMIDNGAFEQNLPLSDDELIEAAKRANANEIVCPDYPLDPEKTLKATINFLSVMSKTERKRFKFCIVPHGKTITQFLENLRALYENTLGEASVVGWSIIDLYKFSYRLRPSMIRIAEHVMPELFYSRDKFEHHLLGLDEMQELMLYRNVPIRSVDTSLPISLAKIGAHLSLTIGTVAHPRIDMKGSLDSSALVLAERNIRALTEVAECV